MLCSKGIFCFQEKFLSEQREVLTQCYEERRELAAERAELSMLQRRALEREQKETQRNLQVRGRGGERLSSPLSPHCYCVV